MPHPGMGWRPIAAISRYRSCLLPARPYGAIICQTTVILERRRRISIVPRVGQPSQFRGGPAAGSPLQLPAGKPEIRPGEFDRTSPPTQSASNQVTFDHTELNRLFGLYGRKVAAGEWRDYAIDFLKDRAVFSVFRRACKVPLYRIKKIRGSRAGRAPIA